MKILQPINVKEEQNTLLQFCQRGIRTKTETIAMLLVLWISANDVYTCAKFCVNLFNFGTAAAPEPATVKYKQYNNDNYNINNNDNFL